MSYDIEWIWPLAPIAVLTLLISPWAGAVLAVVVLLLVAVAILAALVATIVATPFLLARAVLRRRGSGRTRPAHAAQATAGTG
jgi:hypothetical protein